MDRPTLPALQRPDTALAKGPLQRRDLALLVLVVLLWGFNFVPIRLALNEVPALALAALRFSLVAIPLVFFVPRPTLPWRTVVAYGLAVGVGQFGLLFLGIRFGMPAGLAALVLQAQVFFTLLLAAPLLGESLRSAQRLGVALGGVGILALILWEARGGWSASGLGFVLVAGAALCWAVANILVAQASKARHVDGFGLVVWSSLAAPLPLAALSLVLEGVTAPWVSIRDMSATAWGSVLFMVYGASVFGFAAWNRLLRDHPASLVTPFALLIPVAGLASSAVWLQETLSPIQVAASLLVMAGLAVTLAHGTKPRNPSATVAGRDPEPEGRTRI